MKLAKPLWLPCLVSLLLVGSVAATPVRHDPVKLRIVDPPRTVEAWRSVDSAFEIVAAVDVELDNIRFLDGDWRAQSFAPPAAVSLRAGESFRLPFVAVSSVAGGRLGIRYTARGEEFVAYVDMAQLTAELSAGAVGRLLPEDGMAEKAALRWPSKLRTGADGAAMADAFRDDDDSTAAADKQKRSITITGRFAYDREDGVMMPCSYFPYEIYDEDSGVDELLHAGTLDGDGRFEATIDWDPCFVCDSTPDIYVEVVCLNNKLDVQTAWLEWTYGWDTYVADDFTGSQLAFGFCVLENYDAAANMFNIVNRAYGIMYDNGYNVDATDIQWPGDTTSYNPVFEEIHIAENREWNEGSYLHEYGHVWHDDFAELNYPEYCNGICDEINPVLDDCSHCMWCNEHAPTSQDEALANYISYLIGFTLNYTMTPNPKHWRYTEYTGPCEDSDGDPCDCNPYATEGFLTAFLTDLADDIYNADNDTRYHPEWSDVSNLDAWSLLIIADVDKPNDTWGWWRDLKVRYPDRIQEMWRTAMNNNLDFDEQAPPLPVGANSPSHVVGTPSPDATIELEWTAPVDDASGISGYSYAVSGSFGTAPPLSANLPAYAQLVTEPLQPGVYYVTLRSFDHSGRSSPGFVSAGPYTIREPYQSDMIFQTIAGWTQALVPYPTQFTQNGGPPQPTSLTGYGNTYWNFSGKNNGESAIPETMYTDLYLDGVYAGQRSIGGGSPWMEFGFKNVGPVQVPGGLHTIGAVMDGTEVVPETNEDNNDLAYQYIWSPTALTFYADNHRVAPPDPYGGFEALASFRGYNTNGYRITGSYWWNAVYMWPYDDAIDYDLRLHQPSTGPTNGFGASVAWGSRPPGCLDAVIVNRRTIGTQNWDVAVLNAQQDGASNLVLRPIGQQWVGVGGTATLSWSNAVMMGLYEFEVTDTAAGAISVVLQASAYPSKAYIGWLDASFTTGDLLDARQVAQTDANGQARMELDVERTGYHCIAVWRDRRDGLASLNATLDIFRTPPDLVPDDRSGWHAALVPRPFHANTPFAVAAPETLYGNTTAPSGTFFSLAAENRGPQDAYGVDSRVYVDGQPQWSHEWFALLSGIGEYLNWDAARNIRGGRHTVALKVDDPGEIAEISEANNVYGEQWVWGPRLMSLPGITSRPMPPDSYGGFTQITTGEGYWVNCDGLRLPAPVAAINWHAMAVFPGDTSDVDLRLYEAVAGVKTGFRDPLIGSNWGPGQIDYVLIDNMLTPRRAFDVGVVNAGIGNQTYLGGAAGSMNVGRPYGSHGPYPMTTTQYLHLYDFRVGHAGRHTVTIEVEPGAIMPGASIHRGDAPFHSRSTHEPDATTWFEQAGSTASFTFDADELGYYCLVVWKKSRSDAQRATAYTWSLDRYVSAVDDVPAELATGITAIYPNPFNPTTSIVFDVAHPGTVNVSIYDARGIRVRTLVDAPREAKRYREIWDGRDDRGRSLGSGVFFVRLVGAGITDVRKVILMQ